MTIPAGQRNQMVQILQPSNDADSWGQPVPTWAPLGNVWARARPARGTDGVQAGASITAGVVVFGFNYRADVTAAMRIRWRGKDYAIKGEPVDVAGARETTEVTCVEVQA